jgi:phosphatidylglycerophosphatase A
VKNQQGLSQALQQLKSDVWQDPVVFIASGFGLGLMPLTPGSFATLGGLVIYFCIWHWPWWAYLIVSLLVSWIAVDLSDRLSKAYKLHDPTVVCLDEFAGILVTLFIIPTKWYFVLGGFLLFRLFDIWKPSIIGVIDRRMDSGLGMVLDDVVAGCFAWIVLQGLNLLIHHTSLVYNF